MCLAVPARVVRIDGSRARADMLGNAIETDLSLVEGVKEGDYILIHAGFAIQRIEPEEAQETFELLREMGEFADDAGRN